MIRKSSWTADELKVIAKRQCPIVFSDGYEFIIYQRLPKKTIMVEDFSFVGESEVIGEESEITRPMREAGANVIRDLSDVIDPEALAVRVYNAMMKNAKGSSS